MSEGAGAIRTPDQRLRVFVSSTLRELAAERREARGVIERLALAPVMFELGARPHPPRALYRAYLEQSDIFVGIYWESYGWVAPGEEVSGLEDEYNLAPGIPMLIYVKRSEQRQALLETLLDRIRDDDRASYVEFDDGEDLATLLTSDLATLLAERFDSGGRRRTAPVDVPPSKVSTELNSVPAPLSRLIGREDELQRIARMLTTEEHRLITLTGPGGIGKSRLAIAAAREVEGSYPDGVAFVDLAPIRDVSLVIPAIATSLGVRDSPGAPLAAIVAQALGHRRILLVLDNVEQVIGAADDLSRLLSHSSVSMLATSRVLLRIDGEHALTVTPLSSAAAIDLFVQRARAVKPDFDLTDQNESQVAAIAAALENVPLALELAAARVRVLTPAAIVERLDHALPLLSGGARDRPERQRTLRATIDWSTQLLTDPERDLLLRLGVFRSGFALDAVEWMREDLDAAANTVDLLGDLVDSSLVQEHDRASSAWFTMLETVREYARDELEGRGELEKWRQRHALFYSELAARAEGELVGPGQAAWITRLDDEFDDIRATVDHYQRTEQYDAIAHLLWRLYWYVYVSGRLVEMSEWIASLSHAIDQLSEEARYIVRFYDVAGANFLQPDPNRISELEDILEYFQRQQDSRGELFLRLSLAVLELIKAPPHVDAADLHLQRATELAETKGSRFLSAMVLVIRGQAALTGGDLDAATRLMTRSLEAARASGEALLESGALHQLGWLQVMLGDVDGARDYFTQQLLISSTVGHAEGIALALEGLFAVSVTSGEMQRAGRYLGAADDLRERKGLVAPGMFSYHQVLLAQVEASLGAPVLAAARANGRGADLSEVLEEALR